MERLEVPVPETREQLLRKRASTYMNCDCRPSIDVSGVSLCPFLQKGSTLFSFSP